MPTVTKGRPRTAGLKWPAAPPNLSGMTPSTPTDAELGTVARVAVREGWTDLTTPPREHPPRSLDEHAAVARFTAAARARTRRRRLSSGVRLRLALLAVAVVVLGACWYVSPARTALGLIGAGVFCLISLRRSRRRDARAVHGGWARALR